MIYIYSNGDYHSDSEYAEKVLKLGAPLMVMSDVEFSNVFRGRILIEGTKVSFPNNDAEEAHIDALRNELHELENWFEKHRYIAEKIAYRRVKPEEEEKYQRIIDQMDAKADRISEIRTELEEMNIYE